MNLLFHCFVVPDIFLGGETTHKKPTLSKLSSPGFHGHELCSDRTAQNPSLGWLDHATSLCEIRGFSTGLNNWNVSTNLGMVSNLGLIFHKDLEILKTQHIGVTYHHLT